MITIRPSSGYQTTKEVHWQRKLLFFVGGGVVGDITHLLLILVLNMVAILGP